MKCKNCSNEAGTKFKYCSRCREWARAKWHNLPENERKRRNAARYEKNHDEMLAYAKQQGKNLRTSVLQHYGMVCVHCGISDVDVLTIDHIDNTGNLHRKNLHIDGKAIYRWLIKNNFPSGFQTLCRNCNWKKHLQNLRSIHGGC